MSLNPNEAFLSLRHFIKNNEVPLIEMADIIFHLCEQFLLDGNVDEMRKGGYYSITSELPSLIAGLYDQAEQNELLRSKCLDLWDVLYRSDIGNTRTLTQQIMDY